MLKELPWSRGTKFLFLRYTAINMDRDIELRERTVRVEEELKAQRELMREGFAQTEKRFEQIDKRFELMQQQMDQRFDAVDRRFEDMRSYSTRWFTVISIMLTVVGVAVTVSSFV